MKEESLILHVIDRQERKNSGSLTDLPLAASWRGYLLGVKLGNSILTATVLSRLKSAHAVKRDRRKWQGRRPLHRTYRHMHHRPHL